jgi:hypothetical protein
MNAWKRIESQIVQSVQQRVLLPFDIIDDDTTKKVILGVFKITAKVHELCELCLINVLYLWTDIQSCVFV